MWVLSLSWKDPLEEKMASHSSILARIIPWTEEPGGPYSALLLISTVSESTASQCGWAHMCLFFQIICSLGINHVCEAYSGLEENQHNCTSFGST